MTISKNATLISVTYSVDAETFTLVGRPADLYIQLDLLCDLCRTFRLISIKEEQK